MTPMFDELDQELREALALEALPSAGFTDRVMARVARTPQQKKPPAPYRKWLVSAGGLPGGGRGADPAGAQRRPYRRGERR